MRKILLFAAAAVALACNKVDKSPMEYVDPFIGTGFHGHTYPGATYPFGAVQLSPDTRNEGWDACAGYHYDDSTMLGFSHTHLSGTGCADLADILFHPTNREPALRPAGYIFDPLEFSHDQETASPGYYAVELPGVGVRAELTATRYAGMHRYAFREGDQQIVVIDLKHAIDGKRADMIALQQTAPNEIAGMKRTNGWSPRNYTFFVAQFSKEPVAVEYVCDGVVVPEGTEYESNNVQAIVRFGASDGTPLVAKVGLSKVSQENARENLLHDIDGFDFDRVKAATQKDWADNLSKITVEGGTEEQMKLFYTSLYRTRVVPNVMSDVNGQYRRHDLEISKVPEGRRYLSTLSLWDTFRAWHPLMTITDHQLVEDMVWSMQDMYDVTGELPIWPLANGETRCMIGYHAVSVITDAYMKGIRGFNAEKALAAMKHSSNINQKGSKYYIKLGYIPSNRAGESVSCLLEYAYDDWCIARMAEALGHQQDAEEYYQRALNYINVFDGYTRFFRSRHENGNWDQPFNEFEPAGAYTEATPWQYRFFAPHDVNGLVQLWGSRDAFINALDSLYTVDSKIDGHVSDITGLVGQYAQGNEPSHHMAYLYNWVGEPWKTQQMTRRLLDEQYQATPEGISGNEDCGQMSAWYILTSLGIYPVAPGSNQYALTTPLFEKATLQLANGRTLVIEANNPRRNIYIDKVELNGREITDNYLTHSELMEGGSLTFTLRATPNRERATDQQTYPYSLTKGEVVSVPYVTKDLNGFVDSVEVVLGCTTPGASVYYTIDGSEPTQQSNLYTGPFAIYGDGKLQARAYKEGYAPSRVLAVQAVKSEFVDATELSRVANGVRYDYYEGRFRSVSDFAGRQSSENGIIATPSIADASADSNFGYRFDGYINVPEDGVYTFLLRSDDGSKLYVDGIEVIDNDGPHSSLALTGRIALRKGYHPFKLLYFQGTGGYELSFRWMKDGGDGFEEVPAELFFVRE